MPMKITMDEGSLRKKKLVFIGRVEEIICGGNDVVGEGQSMRGRKSIGYI